MKQPDYTQIGLLVFLSHTTVLLTARNPYQLNIVVAWFYQRQQNSRLALIVPVTVSRLPVHKTYSCIFDGLTGKGINYFTGKTGRL
jgi:hypothetical protein